MFPQIFGKYVLEREIAAGGMARVFLATLRGAVGFEKRLVVKQIRPELAVDAAFVRRFVEEAKTAVELGHPNIVPVYELGVEQGIYYIAMEHCAGVTLADVLADTGALAAEEGAYVGAEVCRALDYAHRRAGIVHRDVTPRNVLLDDEGAVKLIDFGIAAPVEPSSGRSREVFGSPGHMPPEQLRGEPLAPAADVFAVGVLLIEAWTAVPPFRRATVKDCLEALKVVPARVDVAVPELAPLAELIARSVALDPKERPADAEKLGRGLREFLRGFDSVEVSRSLAARVRGLRERPHAAASSGFASGDGNDVPELGTTPFLGAPAGGTVTRTFAAREELVEWTRRLSSAPPPASSAPPPAKIAVEARAKPQAGRARGRTGAWLAAGAAVAAVGVLVLLRAPSATSRAEEGTPPAAPLGAPAPDVERQGATHAVVAAAPTAAQDTHSRAPRPVYPATDVTASRSMAATSPSPVRHSKAATPPRASTVPAEPQAARTEAKNPALLRVTADPPAVVTIEAGNFVQTSSTPVRELSLEPGSYRVSFRSETYGSPVATQVTLGSGARRTVHADFRAAVPTVTVR